MTRHMFLKDFIFPKFCLGCGFLGAYICIKCEFKLRYLEKDICLYCRKPSLFGFTHPGCKRAKGVDGFISLYYYNNFMKQIIKNIKYRLATDVWKEFCQVIKPEILSKVGVLKRLMKNDFFIEPIPLHTHKLKLRGFNQAKIIAEFFGRTLNIPLTETLLRKTNTLSQAQLKDHRTRYMNLKGAFKVRQGKETKGKNFVIIDDVLTTGSTMKEATRTMKSSGASSVFALTVAVG